MGVCPISRGFRLLVEIINADETVMLPEVPVIAETVSVAVMVWGPLVFSVAWKLPVPFVRPEFPGSAAVPSELVKWTVPV